MLSLLLILAAGLIPPQCLYADPPVDSPNILGIATAKKQNEISEDQLLYCEFHYAIGVNEWQVDYVSNGLRIATKKLNYLASPFTPNVEQLDFRSGEQRLARYDNHWDVSYRKDAAGQLQRQQLHGQITVIDAGFDHFIRSQWETLQSQKKLSFPFLSIPHLKTLTLRVELKTLSDCEPHSEGFACFSVGADNPFFRLFVGQINLLYSKEKRLIVFDGVVNIQDDNAKSQGATLKYYYF